MADGCSTPSRPREPAPLEDRDDRAEGGQDAEQEPERGGQRHEQRAEHQGEQQEREPDDDQQVGQERVTQLARDVDGDRRLAGDPDRRCPSRP